MIKKCGGCLIEKDFICFYKSKSNKFGLSYLCKDCEKIKKNKIDRNKYNEKRRQHYKEDGERRKQKNREWVYNNPESRKASRKKWRESHKEYESEKRKIRYQKNKEKEAIYNKIRYENNKDIILKKAKEYRNKPEVKERVNERTRERNKTDPVFRATNRVRNRIVKFLKNKNNDFSKSLGCSIEDFKKHIESLFQPGMDWNNYGKGSGKWHIDHKYPISVAYKEGPESFAKACHYTNLQPLWSEENIRKSNKVNNKQNEL